MPEKMTASEAIRLLSNYPAEEVILIDWWDKDGFPTELQHLSPEKATEVWEDVAATFGGTFDHEVSSIWDTLHDQIHRESRRIQNEGV